MSHQCHSFTLDAGWQLKDAGLVAASAAGTVGGSAAYVDLGSASPYQRFALVVKWTACEVASGDEIYTIQVEGADDSSFTTNKTKLALQKFGDSTVNLQSVDTPANGLAVIYGDNVIQTAATSYSTSRYLRVYTTVAGTVGTGMNFEAWLVPLQ